VAACRSDLALSPDAALARLRTLVARTIAPPRARFTITGSRAHTDTLLPELAALFATPRAAEEAPAPAPPPARRLVDERLRDHEPSTPKPVHYGLVHGAGTSGVFVHAAKAGRLDDIDEPTLVTELASRIYGGAGAHGLFMKTWGAGLAYSNGLASYPHEGRVQYYAERCPDLVQTMSFVTGLVKDAPRLDDPYLVEYSVAEAVTDSRESDEYEQRTRAAADDRVDGDTPEKVAAYRRTILALKDRPGLWERIKEKILPAAGRVLPGLGTRGRDAVEGVFLTIAPEPMLARWEKWLRDHEGAEERVFRVYGRDFWMVDLDKPGPAAEQ
jgi:hypothetical protein